VVTFQEIFPVCRNTGQSYNIKTANKLFENVAKFKYLSTAVTNQNHMHEEIKSTISLENAY
jgi:hypothetical protein